MAAPTPFRSTAAAALIALASAIAVSAIPPRWTSRGVGGGGALFSPSWSPHRAGELFVACDMSELFRTTNFAARWQALDFRQIQGHRACRVQFTSDPLLLYALDGASIDGGDTRRPVRSLDGGATWAPLPADPTGMGAYSLFADVSGANRILVSDYTTLYLSTNGGATFSSKFTYNAGGNGCFVSGVHFDGSSIQVGTTAGLVVSTNGGASFALLATGGLPAGVEMASLAGARQGGTARLVAVFVQSGTLYPGIWIEEAYAAYRGVYVLEIGQTNWIARTNGIAVSHRPLFVGMAGNDPAVAYLGGEDTAEYPILYKTTNGGASWQSVLAPVSNQNVITGWCGWQGDRDYTYDAHYVGFGVAPNDTQRVAITGYGFIHVTTNGGATWRQAYTHPGDEHPAGAPTPKNLDYRSVGLENTTCWWIHWSDSNRMFAGYSDIRGLRSTNSGRAWSFNYSGHSYNSTYHLVGHPNGRLYAAVASVHDLYQSTYLTDSRIDGGLGEVLVSADQGATWARLHNFTNVVFSLATDPNRTNRLYAAVVHSTKGGFYRTDELSLGLSASWTKLTAPPRTEGHPHHLLVLQDGTLVCTFSGRRTGSVFTASSGVFVSTNEGVAWLDRSHTNMWYWTKDIVLDPHDPGQSNWYVGVFSGWGGAPNGKGGLYRTLNRGLSWTRLIASDRVTSCAFHPTRTNEFYFTTEMEGLWHSTNIRAPTPSFTQVGNYPFKQPERVFFNPHNPDEIWITSFGHGMRVGSPAEPLITGMAPDAGIRLEWPAEEGERYRVERATALGGPFSPVSAEVEGGSWVDPAPPDAALYRLVSP